ncbi:hypothetical protein [uncultured Salegentibacter sp.]|mgnify:CR=1 FL=1|uniref:hypothetical protein n=1 Tax=uncultured Salegentibacter sp. TaxID=259320 RepID=UPI0030DAFA8D|tara:strand:+ start:421 stop:867 length:447 start_codon:yes stop_codon:yes gene_type:complete
MAPKISDSTHQAYLQYLKMRENNISNFEIAKRLGYSNEEFGYMISQYEFKSNLEYHIPEQEGDYFFNGCFYLSCGVRNTLQNQEIAEIFTFLKRLVKQHDGIDYLQSFYCIEHDCKVFAIDQLSKTMLDSGKYSQEYHYFTLILAEEY